MLHLSNWNIITSKSESDTMFNEQDRRCTAIELMLSNDPSYDNRTIASNLKMQIRMVQRAQGDENKVSGYGYGLWCGFKWGPHHATSHPWSRLKSQHQRVPGCAEEFGDPQVQSGGRWQTLSVAAGLSASPQVQRDSGLASEGVLRLCTLLSLASSSPDLNLLDYFVWSYVENITNMTSHSTKTSLIAAIRRALAGACGKGMLPVPDTYRGGDWGWRELQWIDVSSTT